MSFFGNQHILACQDFGNPSRFPLRITLQMNLDLIRYGSTFGSGSNSVSASVRHMLQNMMSVQFEDRLVYKYPSRLQKLIVVNLYPRDLKRLELIWDLYTTDNTVKLRSVIYNSLYRS